jgi:hypothetical protein
MPTPGTVMPEGGHSSQRAGGRAGKLKNLKAAPGDYQVSAGADVPEA